MLDTFFLEQAAIAETKRKHTTRENVTGIAVQGRLRICSSIMIRCYIHDAVKESATRSRSKVDLKVRASDEK